MIQTRGFDHARAVLRMLPDRIQNNVLRGSVAAIAKDTSAEMQVRAPVDEGVLVENIVHERRRGRRAVVKASVMIRTEGKEGSPRNAFYWRFLEYGTRFIHAMPFVRPVFDALAVRWNAVIARYLPARIENELRKLAR